MGEYVERKKAMVIYCLHCAQGQLMNNPLLQRVIHGIENNVSYEEKAGFNFVMFEDQPISLEINPILYQLFHEGLLIEKKYAGKGLFPRKITYLALTAKGEKLAGELESMLSGQIKSICSRQFCHLAS